MRPALFKETMYGHSLNVVDNLVGRKEAISCLIVAVSVLVFITVIPRGLCLDLIPIIGVPVAEVSSAGCFGGFKLLPPSKESKSLAFICALLYEHNHINGQGHDIAFFFDDVFVSENVS